MKKMFVDKSEGNKGKERIMSVTHNKIDGKKTNLMT